ncbi:MAG: hypothetical protein E7510_14030 [Ruminococcus sp.]|nr:hypothetical protein [Ruminococcus sp.]
MFNGFDFKKLKFEYEVCPDREGNSDKLISLELKNNKYYLGYNHGDNLCVFEISDKIDKLYHGLSAMNINSWNQQCFGSTIDFFPSYFWRLEISADNINVSCRGIDCLPANWNEFRTLLYEAGIADENFPFN